MKRLVRPLLIALAALFGALLVAAGIGLLLPRHHVVVSSLTLRKPATEVWGAIADVATQPVWRSDLTRTERLPDHDGREVWLQQGELGEWAVEFVHRESPRLLVTAVADSSQGFGGTWTYELEPLEDATLLTITERGFIDDPLMRFLARFVFGLHGSQQDYLTDLARHLGEETAPRQVR